MFSGIVSRLLRKKLQDSPSLQSSTNEAASQYLAKQAKLETAVDAVFTNSIRKIDHDERNRVSAYYRSKMPGLANVVSERKDEGMAGDLIVCDDYRTGTGALPVIIMGIVAMASLAVGGFGLWTIGNNNKLKVSPPLVEAPVDQDTQYESRIEIEVR